MARPLATCWQPHPLGPWVCCPVGAGHGRWGSLTRAASAPPSWGPLAIRSTGPNPTRDQLVDIFRAEGVPINTSMSAVKNILRTEVIQKRKYYPLTDAIPIFWQNTTYNPNACPNVDTLQSTCLRLPVDERYTDEALTKPLRR